MCETCHVVDLNYKFGRKLEILGETRLFVWDEGL